MTRTSTWVYKMIFNIDCREGFAMLPDNSVDSIVTDPPYELGFMGHSWDRTGIANDVTVWREALRVLKPGGHVLAFGGSRTYHRMACAIEDAGFEIRDRILYINAEGKREEHFPVWVFGSGFPKNHNLGNGWGTALKPAHEPICVARKPLAQDTVARNMAAWGVGGINIETCRIPIDAEADAGQLRTMNVSQHDGADGWGMNTTAPNPAARVLGVEGRWPANVMHDGIESEWARFFYCAKTSVKDRNAGLESFAPVAASFASGTGLSKNGNGTPRNTVAIAKNPHPTVKPTDLMRYLCRLVTPAGGLVLDPFAGSGSTGKAAILEGFQFIGYELDPHYTDVANARVDSVRT